MATLYAGKTAGILVAFIFLPLYSRLLGPEQFGAVAVILSLQALLVMLDLGMSTLISRDIAAGRMQPKQLLKLLRTAEATLTIFYVVLLGLVLIFIVLRGSALFSPYTILGAVILFWLLVLQNLYYSAMLARRLYTASSIINVIGVFTRAAVTAYVIAKVSSTLTAFIVTQLALGALHFWITRRYCSRLFKPLTISIQSQEKLRFQDCIVLIKRGRSLALLAAAGAAVMQLDKPIISATTSLASVAPYFLATTFCTLPLSVLAGPVSQYFQPFVINAVAQQSEIASSRVIRRFVITLLLVTLIPSIIVWLLRVPLIDLWLGLNASNITIARYVGILLPGVALGALGFIPYSLLISANDFKFQSQLSCVMTVLTLGFTYLYASNQTLEGVCYVYATYHVVSTFIPWLRTTQLTEVRLLGRQSLSLALQGSILLILSAVAIKYFSSI